MFGLSQDLYSQCANQLFVFVLSVRRPWMVSGGSAGVSTLGTEKVSQDHRRLEETRSVSSTWLCKNKTKLANLRICFLCKLTISQTLMVLFIHFYAALFNFLQGRCQKAIMRVN